jgi:hypothetical protein
VITRFDHAVIAVRQLDDAISRFRRLGFDTQHGGRHTGRGTENAIIRFGLDYIELIAVYDEEEARQSGWGGSALVDYLAGQEGGLVGFCLAVDNLVGHVETLRRALPGTIGPLDMQRRHPDGEVLRWRLLIPSGRPWLSAYPFLIEWQLPDEERLSVDKPGKHEIGARSVRAIRMSVPAHELGTIQAIYGEAFGLTVSSQPDELRLGDFAIEQTEGSTNGPVELRLSVGDLEASERRLRSVGARLTTSAARLELDVSETCGAAIVLTA